MMKPEILFLKQEDTIAAGAEDMKMTLELGDKAIKMWAEGTLLNPTKVSMSLDDHGSFFVAMPTYVGGEDDIAGFKWAAEGRQNLQNGLPLGIDVTVLSDPYSVLPKAFLDASLITAMRTAASAALGAKYLCSPKFKKATLVGCGIVGRYAVKAVTLAVPFLEQIEIYDLNIPKAKALADEFKDNDIPVTAVEDLAESVKTSDIIITMTTAQKAFMQKDWMKSNATIVQMGPCDFGTDTVEGADKLFVDNWYQVSKSKLSPVHALHEAGKLNQEDMTELRFVAADMAKGRDNDDQQVMYVSLGLGAMDIMIAHQVYKNAKAMGLGTIVNLWDAPKYV
ncbi:MAG: ornithine cyclodeaminase family protein [Firmicutes bacterium]|nr:ornithine cyclodeaminase family protein [Bacillota bacterium]